MTDLKIKREESKIAELKAKLKYAEDNLNWYKQQLEKWVWLSWEFYLDFCFLFGGTGMVKFRASTICFCHSDSL